MSKRFFNTASALAFTLLFSCAPKPSFKVAELMFDKIAAADPSRAEKFFEYNWRAFDALDWAFDGDADTSRAYGLFSTFFLASTEQNIDELTHNDIRAMIEYMSNLMATTPNGGILIVAGDDDYRLARYTRVIHPQYRSIAVLNIDYIQNENYRDYLEKEHGIIVPKEVFARIADSSELRLFYDVMLDWFTSSSGREVYLGMGFPVYSEGRSYFVGPGRLYNVDLSPEEHKRLVLELYSERYSFEHCNAGWGKFVEKTNSMVYTYGEGLAYHAGKWLDQNDTAAVNLLAEITSERLPHHWQTVNLQFAIRTEPTPEFLDTLIFRLEKYLAEFPQDRSAHRLAEKIRNKRGSL